MKRRLKNYRYFFRGIYQKPENVNIMVYYLVKLFAIIYIFSIKKKGR